MIHRRASATQIHARAVEKGMRTLRQDGWEKVKKGLTTPEEVIRVTQESLQ
jgi:type II secretory ATPase GspE/PulE/Tfp pilus assembly ATPase PilB-like protein